MEVRFLTAGDRAVSVEFGKTICLETNAKVRMLDENLKEDPIEGMIETVPTYCALIIHYRPEVIRYGKLVKELEKRLGVAKINFGTEIRYKYVEHYEEALKTNHQGHSWKLSQLANDALTEDIKKIIRLAGSEGKA